MQLIKIHVINNLKRVPFYLAVEPVALVNCPIINQRLYRARKIKKGRRVIRRNHYQLRPFDLVKHNNQVYQVKGIQNKGNYVKLINNSKSIVKAIFKVKILYHVNGVNTIIKY